MSVIDDLVLRIKADVAGLVGGLAAGGKVVDNFVKKSTASFNKLDGAIKNVAASAAKWGIVGAAAGLAFLTKRSFESIDALNKMAEALSISTEQLSALHYAAERFDVPADRMNLALKTMSLNLSEAHVKGSRAAASLETIGLTAGKLSGLSVDEQFKKIADAMSSTASTADRVRVSTELFGKEGLRLSSMLKGGSSGLAEMEARARALGQVISQVDANKVSAAKDELEGLGSIFTGIGNTLAVKISPVLGHIAGQIVDWAVRTGIVEKAANFLYDAFVEVLKFINNGWQGIVIVLRATEVGILKMATGFLRFAAEVQHGFQVMWEVIKRTGIAIADTYDYTWKVVGKGVDWLQFKFMQFIDSTAKAFGNLVVRMGEGMTAMGVKGAASVMDLGHNIRNSTGTALAQYNSDLNATTAATEAAAKKMAESWATVNNPIDREENAVDRAANATGDLASSENDKLAAEIEGGPRGDKIQALLDEIEETSRIQAEARAAEKAAEDEVSKERVKSFTDEQTKMRELWKSGLMGRLQIAGSILGQLSTLQQSHSRKAFEVGKAAAIAETVINTYKAAMGAYSAMSAIPIVGPALGVAAAGAAVAAGMTNIQNIKSQSFGGGGSSGGSVAAAGTGAGGAAPSGGDPAGAFGGGGGGTTRNVTLNLGDDVLLDGNGVRRLIDRLNEAQGDGYKIRVN